MSLPQQKPARKQSSFASRVSSSLIHAGLRPIARITQREPVQDIAIDLAKSRLVVVRVAPTTLTADYTALATMLRERTFVWAGLVYETLDHPGGVGGVESFHVSELDRLVARLLELQEVYREAG